MRRLPRPRWLIDGVLPDGDATLLFGASNAFKSFLALDMALSVATGTAWHGIPVPRAGNALVVATEGAAAVGSQRVPAWMDHHEIPDVDRRVVRLWRDDFHLDDPNVPDELARFCQTDGIALVVIDVFGATVAGSEIDDRAARAWARNMQRTLRAGDVATLTVAHKPHGENRRARMHSHLWGSFGTRLDVTRGTDDGTAILRVDRHKDADSAGVWGFRMEAFHGSLVPRMDASAVKSNAGSKRVETEPNEARGKAAADVLAVLVELERAGSPVTDKAWRAAYYRTRPDDRQDTKKRAFGRAREELVEAGKVAFDGTFYRPAYRDITGQSNGTERDSDSVPP